MTAEPGLTSADVAQRVAAGQANTLPPRSGRTSWQIVRDNVFTRVNLILLVLFVIVLTTGRWLQGAFGLLIIANSVVGIVQELRAKRTLDNLAIVGEGRPTVVRDGAAREVARDEVVLDDLVVLRPGDQVVVDGSVVEADYLEVDESMLTGEADPVAKGPGDEVMSGAFVVSGTGTYRAEKVGADAYAAQITAQASKFTLMNSELRQGIDQILGIISFLLVPVGLLTIWVQFRQEDQPWQDSVLGMVAALVPMVPEGLVLLTSMAFALGVIRLGKRKCLVNELPAIEGLARVDVVCADKTGTLTQNAMTVGELICVGSLDEAGVKEALSQLAASDPAPNASMQAVIEHVGQAGDPWQVTSRAPFTSAKKWSGATFAAEGSWLLGAPDVLATGEIADRAEEIASTGRRVLLLARGGVDVTSGQAPGRVESEALVVLDQLIRPDAADTLEFFNSQDVEVKVISGDNAASVGAVTRSLGVSAGDPVDARELPDDDAAFAAAVEEADVFGRVTPQQKRRMVGALRDGGHTVAMTGDGVNDVLALKDADLGVAMGSGSDATRSVAQIVLLDDRFSTLPHVVAEGRRVIGNIERVAKLFLTKTIYSVLLALVIGLMGMPYPFLPLQLTVVGWFTIGIPAFLLSLAPNRDRARTGFVPRVLAVGVPCGVVVGAVTVVTYVMVRGFGDVAPELQTQASTAALAALIISSSWVLATVSRPWVVWRIGLVAVGYSFYLAVFMLPFSRRVLELDVSNQSAMVTGIIAGLVGAVAVEITWWVTASIRKEPAKLFR